jgi:hypothetical protein
MQTKKTPDRIQRYRAHTQRFEWHPSPDVLDIIKHHPATGVVTVFPEGVSLGLVEVGAGQTWEAAGSDTNREKVASL